MFFIIKEKWRWLSTRANEPLNQIQRCFIRGSIGNFIFPFLFWWPVSCICCFISNCLGVGLCLLSSYFTSTSKKYSVHAQAVRVDFDNLTRFLLGWVGNGATLIKFKNQDASSKSTEWTIPQSIWYFDQITSHGQKVPVVFCNRLIHYRVVYECHCDRKSKV